MKKSLIIIIAIVLGFGTMVKADEGMWIPMLINKNIIKMHEMGLQLSAEDIYSVNHSSLKDAIIIFGRGCTGEIISPEGLILTNHHCGYGSVQKVSTVENDILADGFWSTSKEEEIPIEGLSVKFLVRMEDATASSLKGVSDDMSEADRAKTISENIKAIVEEATNDNNYKAIVETFYGGNEYYLFVYETFTDIRLVGVPPEAIGKFGADTDNWMWPRHTGDFSMFRVYTAPDGSPTDYAKENIPMKSKHFLPVNIAGVEKGDFAMIMGNPGSTQRYLSSYGVDLAVNQTNMTRVKIRAEKLRIMKEGMDADDSVRLQYASKYAGVANYWKYFIGQTRGLKRLKVKDKKLQEEAEFMNWVNKSAERKAKYGETMNLISSAYDKIAETNLSKWYFIEGVYRGPEILRYAYGFNKLSKELNKKKEADIGDIVTGLKENIEGHFKDYNQTIDKNMFASMMRMYHANVPLDQQPAYLLEMDKKFKGDYEKYAEYLFSRSIFGEQARVEEFLSKPKAKTLKKDPAMLAVEAFFSKYRELAAQAKEAYGSLEKGHRLYIAGLREMNADKTYYPDANFTMRLTYGTVQDYYPADAVHYEYFTTMDGIMQKEDPTSFEFIVPARLKELYEAGDFGPYGNDDGSMNVCFLTNHDITGGNSGSPVINGKGELIGLAFDGNWEAMSGDIAFEPELQRTINVDIRYVMFIIDKYAGAKNIIDEITLVNERPVVMGDVKAEEKVTEDSLTE